MFYLGDDDWKYDLNSTAEERTCQGCKHRLRGRTLTVPSSAVRDEQGS